MNASTQTQTTKEDKNENHQAGCKQDTQGAVGTDSKVSSGIWFR